MDATEYVKIVLDVSVAAAITLVLFVLARRARKEQTFTGFKARSIDEKYAGYAMLAIGIAIIAVSIVELVVLMESDPYSAMPFKLSDISMTVGNQTTVIASGHLLGLVFGVSFWLTVFGYGGRKFASLGLDLLRGRKIKLRRNR
jgi:hypothetical protein